MRAIGIILAGGNSKRMKELSNKRAIAAMPVAGSYRAIDFALSNMSNSHIQKVAVLMQYNSRSLIEHLNSSKWWDFGRKRGGLFLFTPTITVDNGFWYRGTADAIYQNLTYLRSSHEPYVVIASGDGIYKLDYRKVLEYHIAKNADMTIVTTKLSSPEECTRLGCVVTDENKKVIQFEEKPLMPKSCEVSTGVYVIRRRLLIELMEKAAQEERFDFVSDVIIRYLLPKEVYAYEMKEYWSNIASVESYYNTNMDFLKKGIRDYFFKQYPDIYSKIQDMPPAKYNSGCNVKNSLISSGCIINGRVENSLLFKKVYVGNNCTIKNSIILNDVYISDNTYIENCIVESRVTLKPNMTYIGEEGNVKIVIEKNDRFVL